MSSISLIDREALSATLARIGIGRAASSGFAAPRGMSRMPLAFPNSVLIGDLAPGLPPSAFEPPDGALQERLEAFMDWLAAVTGCRRHFIVERDGLPLTGSRDDTDLMTLASSVMKLVDDLEFKLGLPVGGTLSLDLQGVVLQLVAVDTNAGRYTVGMLVDRPLAPPVRSAIERGLRASFEP